MTEGSILLIGGGNMAGAIVQGCLDRKVFGAADWLVVEPDAARREWFQAKGVASVAAIQETKDRPIRTVLLAVKPQMLGTVAEQWRSAGMWFEGVVITMLAGTPTLKVRAALGESTRVVRVMPNLPASIGRGATAVALGDGALPGDEALAMTIFGGVGRVVERVDEPLMDAVTALSGSGPAYLFYLAEAMVRAGIEAGLPADVADRLVRETLVGASEMLSASRESPRALRAAVTSKGGTTEAAVGVLDGAVIADVFVKAIIAARDRGRELSGLP